MEAELVSGLALPCSASGLPSRSNIQGLGRPAGALQPTGGQATQVSTMPAHGPLTSMSLAKAFPTNDRGIRFARRAALRVSLGPMDRTGSDADGSDNDGEHDGDEPLSPLLLVPACAPRKSESPRCLPDEAPEAFARRMLLVCRKVARDARNDGPNLYASDSSSVSPVKRRGVSSASASPTKRRTLGATDTKIDAQRACMWEPVYKRRPRCKEPLGYLDSVQEGYGFDGL